MKILVCGATGFIGQNLVPFLSKQGHDVSVLGRNPKTLEGLFNEAFKCFGWDLFANRSSLAEFDVVINLAGENIAAKNWSNSRKQAILHSRIDLSHLIAKKLSEIDNGPRLLNASAIGVYGFAPIGDKNSMDETISLNMKKYPDFLSEVARKWELATECLDQGKRSNLRFGVVLDKSGGALPKMAMPFYFGVGGIVGSGEQILSWISMNDLLRSIAFVLQHTTLCGPINICAPSPVSQRTFAHSLAKQLRRPAFIPMPSFAIKLLFGEMGEALLLNGQRVFPKRLLDAGFVFQHENLDSALKACYSA